jgi:IS5 family transposase
MNKGQSDLLPCDLEMVAVLPVPGRENDTQALVKLPLQVAEQSRIYMDAGYTSYSAEDLALEAEGIRLMIDHRSNNRRKDEPHVRFLKKTMRKRVETTFLELKAQALHSIHAVN